MMVPYVAILARANTTQSSIAPHKPSPIAWPRRERAFPRAQRSARCITVCCGHKRSHTHTHWQCCRQWCVLGHCVNSTGKELVDLLLCGCTCPVQFVLLEIGYQPYCVGAIICNGGVNRQLTTYSVVACGTVVAIVAGSAVDDVGLLQRAKINGAAVVHIRLVRRACEAAENGCTCPAHAGQETRDSSHW